MPLARSQVKAYQKLISKMISVAAISEPLSTVKANESTERARAIMLKHSFDVLGVTTSMKVFGYVHKDHLGQGTCGQYRKTIEASSLVAGDTPLLNVMPDIARAGRLFQLGRSGPAAVVTRADLDKPPVRVLLFAILCFLEEAALDWIRTKWKDDGWQTLLRGEDEQERLQRARTHRERARRRNQDLCLATYLTLQDKLLLLARGGSTAICAAFDSDERVLQRLQTLRNDIAHGAPIVVASTRDWSAVLGYIDIAEKLLTRLGLNLGRR